MLNKVLVPLDGSPLATCVIPHLVAITRATDAQITLLRVTEMSNDQSGRINPVEWHLSKVEAQTYLDEIAERLGQFTDQKPDTQVLQGPAAERIIEYAQKHSYDLIVLSTHGQSGLNGWNVSSVAMKVINRAGLSILLVPAYRPDMGLEGNWDAVHYEHILAPLDGSQRAEFVLPIAASLTQQYQAELLLAHVVVRPEMIQRMPLTSEDTTLADQVVERNQIQATKYFEQLQNRLSPAPRTRIIVSDHLTSELHKLLEQEEIDLVLVSAHGNSGQNQWPYGSVVTSFITHSAVPLLILQDLPLYEIQPTEAERATSVKQQVWRKSNGHNENYGEREQNGQTSGQAGQSLQSVFTNIKKNYGIRETPKVRAYAYTALL